LSQESDGGHGGFVGSAGFIKLGVVVAAVPDTAGVGVAVPVEEVVGLVGLLALLLMLL